MFPKFNCSNVAIHNEAQFQSFITNRIASKKIFIKKLSDSDMSYKPCDFFYQNSEGSICAVELKYLRISDGLSFKRDMLRPNQHASLGKIAENSPNSALVWIYIEYERDYIVFRYSDFKHILRNRKSVTIDELKEVNIAL